MTSSICQDPRCGHEEYLHGFDERPCFVQKCPCKKFIPQDDNHSPQKARFRKGTSEAGGSPRRPADIKKPSIPLPSNEGILGDLEKSKQTSDKEIIEKILYEIFKGNLNGFYYMRNEATNEKIREVIERSFESGITLANARCLGVIDEELIWYKSKPYASDLDLQIKLLERMKQKISGDKNGF